MKNVYYFLIGIFLFVAFSPLTHSQTDPNNPNILLIIADDLGVDAMNGYQNSALLPNTPTLDSLRTNGLTFKNAWAAPKCTPTRASIMSGKFGAKTGVLGTPGNLDPVHTSIFKAIEDQTGGVYADAVIGKWHISDPLDYNHPTQLNVDYYEGFIDGNVGNYYNWTRTLNGVDSTVTEYATSFLTDASIDWVNDQTQPWFLWLAHAGPHGPHHLPPVGTYTQAPTNTNKQKFMAMLENLDYEVNRLLSNIPQPVRDNTIVIFVGDNGTAPGVNQNYTNVQGKGTVYQGGVHVPLVVSGPNVTRINEEEEGLIHAVDIYATLLDMVGANLPGGIYHSHSFYDALSGNAPLRPYNYSEMAEGSGSDFTIRNEQYKLLEFTDGRQEFYDLFNDSLETMNLINNLTEEQLAIKLELENEAHQIRQNWSCRDAIQNGNETSIDCGGNNCFDCLSMIDLPCNIDWREACDHILLDSSIVAKDYIGSEHTISSQNARLWAGNHIELKAGFEFTGGDLDVEINDCDELGIDDSQCANSNVTSQTNIGCCETPAIASEYTENISGDLRTISSNNFPNHDYCYSGNKVPNPINRTFNVDATPTLANTVTSLVSDDNRPRFFYGVALNGVLLAPAPAQPFIFENPNTGEYNWDWIFEPTNVQGSGAGFVKLDCSSAHTGGQGYHYHGNMYQYVEEVIQPGLSTTTTPPAGPILVGWAADGYPIVYRFGPDGAGNLALLQPSYQLKYGNRPGDGVTAPCGSYNGRYTKDYEYIACSGDLDECNGVARTITLTTPQGVETFDYFYVITDAFPQIGRCLSGTPDPSFN